MIDIEYIRDPQKREIVKKNIQDRRMKVDIDALVQLDSDRLALQQQLEGKRREANEIADRFASVNAEEKKELATTAKQLKTLVKELETRLQELETQWKDLMMSVPNFTHPDAPIGEEGSEAELKKWGNVPQFDFVPKNHIELGESLNILDFERAATVSGQKFYFLKNGGALLELALVRFAIDQSLKYGAELMITPDLARKEILEGTGYNPRGKETQVYSIAESDLALIGTAEITLGGYHANSFLPIESLPKKYVGLSHCFRTEAGAYGKESTGLYRVHQFTKVELFAYCLPEQSDVLHQQLLDFEETIYQQLAIPYRVIDTPTGDLGAPAYRKFDIEAWMPFRNGYGEVTSTSNVTDYQARRLHIKYKEGGKSQYVHMLNGTVIAVPRVIIAILENFQTAQGTVRIPEVLQPYMGMKEIITRTRS